MSNFEDYKNEIVKEFNLREFKHGILTYEGVERNCCVMVMIYKVKLIFFHINANKLYILLMSQCNNEETVEM